MLNVTVAKIRTLGSAVAKPASQEIDAHAYRHVPPGVLFAQQGDVYLKKLREVPPGADRIAPYRQLVPGASLGSRHCLDHTDGIVMYLFRAPTALDGPIIETYRPVTVTHPVHGDIANIPAGAVFQVVYQRAYADSLQRVVD